MSILGKKLIKHWTCLQKSDTIKRNLFLKIGQWNNIMLNSAYYKLNINELDKENYVTDNWGNKFILEISGRVEKLEYIPEIKFTLVTQIKITNETAINIHKNIYQQFIPSDFRLNFDGSILVYGEKSGPYIGFRKEGKSFFVFFQDINHQT